MNHYEKPTKDYTAMTTTQLQNEIEFQETFGKKPLRRDEDELEMPELDLNSEYYND